MVPPGTQCFDNDFLKNKMEIAHPSKLIKKDELMYYKKNDDASLTSIYDITQQFSRMTYKDTIYLGIVPISEALPKTGYGHFYLYHLYKKEIKNIKDLDISLKLFALVKTSPDVGLHIPVVKKPGYTTTSTSMKNYYALGSFDNNKRKFESIDKLIDYYKQVNPIEILKDNKKLLNDYKVIETRIDIPGVANKHSSNTDSSLISDIKKQPVNDSDYKNITKKDTIKNISKIKNQTNKGSSNNNSYTSKSSLYKTEEKPKITCKFIKSGYKNIVDFTNLQKWEYLKSLRNQRYFDDQLHSSSTSGCLKSTDSSSKLIKKSTVQKKNKSEKLKRDENFYTDFFFGSIRRKEAKKKVKKPFDFAFYVRKSKKNPKKVLYLVYKPLKGKPIHLKIIKKRDTEFNDTKASKKHLYAVITPYKTYDYFSKYEEMVDYYYDRIERVKELYCQFIR